MRRAIPNQFGDERAIDAQLDTQMLSERAKIGFTRSGCHDFRRSAQALLKGGVGSLLPIRLETRNKLNKARVPRTKACRLALWPSAIPRSGRKS
jgi:hypothetical protein